MPEPTTRRDLLAAQFYGRVTELKKAHEAAEAAIEKLREDLDPDGLARFPYAVVAEVDGIKEQLADLNPVTVQVDTVSLLELIELADKEPDVPETAASRA